MAEYTYKDVIIDPEDPRVEIGKEYYFGDNPGEVLKWANGDGVAKAIDRINRDNFPFCHDGIRFPCIIRKKESEKKHVPFDLSKEEDRARLRGAWIRSCDFPLLEYQIISMNKSYVFCDAEEKGISPELLFTGYEFVDGTPCGKLVEAEDAED